MKFINVSKLALVFGLALGLMVSWAAVSPTTSQAKSVIGGWVLVPCGTDCYGSYEESCSDGPTGTTGCSPSNLTWVCDTGGTGGACYGGGYDDCDLGGDDTCPGSEGICSAG